MSYNDNDALIVLWSNYLPVTKNKPNIELVLALEFGNAAERIILYICKNNVENLCSSLAKLFKVYLPGSDELHFWVAVA